MDRKQKIDQEVEKTLQCFKHPENLEENPYFYTHLKARIDKFNNPAQENSGWGFIGGVLKPALLFLMIVLNIFMATTFFKNQNNYYSSREQMLKAFAEEFMLDSNQTSLNLFISE